MSQVTLRRTISHLGPLQIAIILLAVVTGLVHLYRGLMMTFLAGAPPRHFAGPPPGHFAAPFTSDDACVHSATCAVLPQLPRLHRPGHSTLSPTLTEVSAGDSLDTDCVHRFYHSRVVFDH
jgi:hypothetical protein